MREGIFAIPVMISWLLPRKRVGLIVLLHSGIVLTMKMNTEFCYNGFVKRIQIEKCVYYGVGVTHNVEHWETFCCLTFGHVDSLRFFELQIKIKKSYFRPVWNHVWKKPCIYIFFHLYFKPAHSIFHNIKGIVHNVYHNSPLSYWVNFGLLSQNMSPVFNVNHPLTSSYKDHLPEIWLLQKSIKSIIFHI